jgi:hypothetical protein
VSVTLGLFPFFRKFDLQEIHALLTCESLASLYRRSSTGQGAASRTIENSVSLHWSLKASRTAKSRRQSARPSKGPRVAGGSDAREYFSKS